jgi:hypothetical protein
VPSAVLGAEETAMNNRDKTLPLTELTWEEGRQ